MIQTEGGVCIKNRKAAGLLGGMNRNGVVHEKLVFKRHIISVAEDEKVLKNE